MKNKYTCPTCDVTQPDNWCGGCGKVIVENKIMEILKEHIQVCNCEDDDNWHIDEADFESCKSSLLQAVLEVMPEKYNEPKNSSLTEERIIWTKGYDQSVSDITERVRNLFTQGGGR